jgi:putative aminopeptidase FrvX
MMHLRSVDNLATVYVCLELIKSLSREQHDLNITFVFSKLEEVFQLTATGVALRGATLFGNFSNNTHFIVLEAAPVCRGNIEGGAKSP